MGAAHTTMSTLPPLLRIRARRLASATTVTVWAARAAQTWSVSSLAVLFGAFRHQRPDAGFAGRIRTLRALITQIKEIDSQIATMVTDLVPTLTDIYGIGTLGAAEILDQVGDGAKYRTKSVSGWATGIENRRAAEDSATRPSTMLVVTPAAVPMGRPATVSHSRGESVHQVP